MGILRPFPCPGAAEDAPAPIATIELRVVGVNEASLGNQTSLWAWAGDNNWDPGEMWSRDRCLATDAADS